MLSADPSRPPLFQGSGQIIDEYCGSCSGRGRVQKSKQLMITIPPGVDSGSRLRIRREGDAGPKGGQPGDLYVFISVQPSKDFKRDGADIYSQARPRALARAGGFPRRLPRPSTAADGGRRGSRARAGRGRPRWATRTRSWVATSRCRRWTAT